MFNTKNFSTMKKFFFSILSIAAFATIITMASCNKDNADKKEEGGNKPAEYVDLDLTSHTKWKSENEPGYYDHPTAAAKFGESLPTKAQLVELKYECNWVWNADKKGFDIKGSNGNSIFLPAAGYIDCVGDLRKVGQLGFYWSSTLDHDDYYWDYYFVSDSVGIYSSSDCHNLSVRLVQND